MNRFIIVLALLLAAFPLLADIRVVVLGATTDMELIERWASTQSASLRETPDSQSFRIDAPGISVVAPSSTASMSFIATALYKADVAMIVMDTTQGPLPGLREHVIASRQARAPVVAMMMANVDDLFSLGPKDARELLTLEEEEFRNVLSLYEVGGPETLLFHDSQKSTRAPRSSSGDLSTIAKFIADLDPSRDPAPQLESHRSALAQVYFLADAEADGLGIQSARQWSLEMWCEGSSSAVDVNAAQIYGSGDIGAVDISASEAFSAFEGSRFLLLENGHIVGLGVLSKLGDF